MYGRGKSITWWLHGLSLINDGGQQLLLLKICAFANTCIWMPVKKKSKKLGQANSLNGKRWLDWLCHVRDNSGGKYFLALYLTQVLCIRISQALQLRVCDFNFRDRTVWIAPDCSLQKACCSDEALGSVSCQYPSANKGGGRQIEDAEKFLLAQKRLSVPFPERVKTALHVQVCHGAHDR